MSREIGGAYPKNNPELALATLKRHMAETASAGDEPAGKQLDATKAHLAAISQLIEQLTDERGELRSSPERKAAMAADSSSLAVANHAYDNKKKTYDAKMKKLRETDAAIQAARMEEKPIPRRHTIALASHERWFKKNLIELEKLRREADVDAAEIDFMDLCKRFELEDAAREASYYHAREAKEAATAGDEGAAATPVHGAAAGAGSASTPIEDIEDQLKAYDDTINTLYLLQGELEKQKHHIEAAVINMNPLERGLVPQGCAVMLSVTDALPLRFLTTTGCQPCVAVAIRHPGNPTLKQPPMIALAHLDSSAQVAGFNKRKASPSPAKAQIAGEDALTPEEKRILAQARETIENSIDGMVDAACKHDLGDGETRKPQDCEVFVFRSTDTNRIVLSATVKSRLNEIWFGEAAQDPAHEARAYVKNKKDRGSIDVYVRTEGHEGLEEGQEVAGLYREEGEGVAARHDVATLNLVDDAGNAIPGMRIYNIDEAYGYLEAADVHADTSVYLGRRPAKTSAEHAAEKAPSSAVKAPGAGAAACAGAGAADAVPTTDLKTALDPHAAAADAAAGAGTGVSDAVAAADVKVTVDPRAATGAAGGRGAAHAAPPPSPFSPVDTEHPAVSTPSLGLNLTDALMAIELDKKTKESVARKPSPASSPGIMSGGESDSETNKTPPALPASAKTPATAKPSFFAVAHTPAAAAPHTPSDCSDALREAAREADEGGSGLPLKKSGLE